MAWKAKLVLFMGFALIAGGLAGSVVGSAYARSWVITLTNQHTVFLDSQIYCSAIPVPNTVFWSRKCHRELAHHA